MSALNKRNQPYQYEPKRNHCEVAYTHTFPMENLHHSLCRADFTFGRSYCCPISFLTLFHHVLNLAGNRAAAWSPDTLHNVGNSILAVWRI